MHAQQQQQLQQVCFELKQQGARASFKVPVTGIVWATIARERALALHKSKAMPQHMITVVGTHIHTRHTDEDNVSDYSLYDRALSAATGHHQCRSSLYCQAVECPYQHYMVLLLIEN